MTSGKVRAPDHAACVQVLICNVHGVVYCDAVGRVVNILLQVCFRDTPFALQLFSTTLLVFPHRPVSLLRAS